MIVAIDIAVVVGVDRERGFDAIEQHPTHGDIGDRSTATATGLQT